jgi:hypothetical protein
LDVCVLRYRTESRGEDATLAWRRAFEVRLSMRKCPPLPEDVVRSKVESITLKMGLIETSNQFELKTHPLLVRMSRSVAAALSSL